MIFIELLSKIYLEIFDTETIKNKIQEAENIIVKSI